MNLSLQAKPVSLEFTLEDYAFLLTALHTTIERLREDIATLRTEPYKEDTDEVDLLQPIEKYIGDMKKLHEKLTFFIAANSFQGQP